LASGGRSCLVTERAEQADTLRQTLYLAGFCPYVFEPTTNDGANTAGGLRAWPLGSRPPLSTGYPRELMNEW
jgi:hypothetical protein